MAYVFDPEVLHEIARGAVGTPMHQMVPRLAAEIGARYPGSVEPSPEWVFNNAGGAMGAMAVLHASLSEYLIVFGTPIGTEGHSGRFWADDYFMILDGEQWAYTPGSTEREVYKPGDLHLMPRGVAKGYKMPERCWALEYARGWIPFMLPFGFADGLSSTLDVRTLARTVKLYTRSAIKQLAQGKI
jgi:C-8 sterol isomerase